MLGVIVVHAYCNSAAKEAFGYVWEGFFNVIKMATGKEIEFKVFNDSRNIQCIILDMEAAQVQGLGGTIIQMKMNDPLISKIAEIDPDIIIQYLIKLCYIHWDRYKFCSLISSFSVLIIIFNPCRGTEKLTGLVGHDIVKYLNKF